MDKVGVPHTLRDVGIPESDIEKMPMRLWRTAVTQTDFCHRFLPLDAAVS